MKFAERLTGLDQEQNRNARGNHRWEEEIKAAVLQPREDDNISKRPLLRASESEEKRMPGIRIGDTMKMGTKG